MEVPGYTEIRELGHGGTGRVMLAVRDSDGLAVAIKHLSEALRENAEFVARFRAEAQVIREIDSPYTARLLDYVEAGDDAVIVMELVDGITLRRLLEHEGGTGAEAALVVLKGALLGLAEAHRRGIVHRDFKPENVIITQDGDSKLVDFGVAAHSGESADLAGTPSYMAPEQWDDAPAGPATDVYAATLVFFECLTGHRAFQGENVAALAYQHQHVPPPVEEVEEPLRPLVEHGLAKDPADRPESAEAFLAELEQVALDAYGEEWELSGRTGLGILTLPLAALLPKPQPVADGGTSLFHSTLTPMTKFAMTSGLVLATAAAVAASFVILVDTPEPESGAALPPVRIAPSLTEPPAPRASERPEPSPSPSGTPPESLRETPPVDQPGTDVAVPPAERPLPTRARPEPPRATREPTREPTRTTRPTARPSTPATSRPPTTAPPTSRPPSTSPPDDDPSPTRPPATPPPDTPPPGPDTPPGGDREPLVSVSVKVSLNVPILSGEGDGLLDADVGLGLGSSLLGLVVVPGSALLGRRIVARRVRRRPKIEKPEME
ncbi:serine/threonine-protein kinase [Nonomuraea jiangxiensis]|uniref:non-specific serine/threonine protein kinase n=1 Tax=Nonomuraea jiangxiensis TaxID=633440 RepID=A0A1G8KAT9_9ACTN|nr:serine/threonine-protein kinase [Nonomuraea jiangxiensis]SDI40503.1 serine/threonine protein kinase [Nonomuraea jiangxiensis]